MSRLVLVLGDQLSEGLSALAAAEKGSDVVVMAEVSEEATYVQHHPKKIAFIFSAMRKFAARLRDDGWDVRYTRLDDAENAGSIHGELLRRAEETGAFEVIATQPGEWRLIEALEDMPLRLTMKPDTRFVSTQDEFDTWAEGRKALRMEYFYRDMRRKTGLLMDGDDPVGGQWNYDAENRKPAPDDIAFSGPMQFTPDETVQEVLDLVEARFGNSFGSLRPFWFATDQAQARRALSHFITYALPRFGDFQDAMMNDNRFLYHALVSPYMNVGLLDPMEVCRAAEDAYTDGHAPLNAVEGFIRQIIGWREYVRRIYFREGPDYTRRNALDHQRRLPDFYWTGETDMNCLSKAITQTADEAYAHHIQRLMVTGNFALLAGVHPEAICDWYLGVYADAFDWVERPNTQGMVMHADGGILGSKPYAASGKYINRMSDHCRHCVYNVNATTGPDACPFNSLYWHFIDRHREHFKSNPRMGMIYRNWEKQGEEQRAAVLAKAEEVLVNVNAL